MQPLVPCMKLLLSYLTWAVKTICSRRLSQPHYKFCLCEPSSIWRTTTQCKLPAAQRYICITGMIVLHHLIEHRWGIFIELVQHHHTLRLHCYGTFSRSSLFLEITESARFSASLRFSAHTSLLIRVAVFLTACFRSSRYWESRLHTFCLIYLHNKMWEGINNGR